MDIYGRLNPNQIMLVTLWLFNIVMENGPCILDFPIKIVIFHGYVK